jgi:hypothetical protein
MLKRKREGVRIGRTGGSHHGSEDGNSKLRHWDVPGCGERRGEVVDGKFKFSQDPQSGHLAFCGEIFELG